MPENTNDWSRKPFREALAFFRQKGIVTTKAWTDMLRDAHDHAFTVAGLANKSAVEEFFNAIKRQHESGISFNAFQKDFDAIVAKYGWDHNGDRAWRARTIFQTNLRSSYSAGRWAQMQDPAAKQALPYMLYKHSGAEHFRPLHKSWDGLVLLATDKFWKTNLPPNGWGCKCQFFPLSARSAKKLGKSGPDQNPYDAMAAKGLPITESKWVGPLGKMVEVPRGVDPGWDYAPGASWAARFTPEFVTPDEFKRAFGSTSAVARWNASGQALLALPPMRAMPAAMVLSKAEAEAASDEALLTSFLKPFGADVDTEVFFTDVVGEKLLISKQLFTRKSTGELKLRDAGRERYLALLAETIRVPDEIWLTLEALRDQPGAVRLQRRYIARFSIDGATAPAVVAFTVNSSTWTGSTAFTPRSERYLVHQRVGHLVHRRQP